MLVDSMISLLSEAGVLPRMAFNLMEFVLLLENI